MKTPQDMMNAIDTLADLRRRRDELNTQEWGLVFEIHSCAVDVGLKQKHDDPREIKFICRDKVVALTKGSYENKVNIYELSTINRLTAEGLKPIEAA